MTFIKLYLNRYNVISWLIIANVVVWVALRLCVFLGAGSVGVWLELPSQCGALINRPWTLVTYMWVQYDIFHLVCNMVMLYYFGQICSTLGRERYVLPTYLCGGVVGALCYIAVASIGLHVLGNGLIGSSAAVIAIGVFAAFTSPELPFGVWLLGEVQLRWIVTAVVMIMCIGALATSVGELFTHLGGVAAGALTYFISHSQASGRKAGCLSATDSIENLDHILDKVKRSGYSSLNSRERKALFEISNKLNRQ